MADDPADATSAPLEPPVLLLAMPQVLDPFFHKSVVLLVHHQDEGSLGFIVNRPTTIKVGDVLKGLEIQWQGQDGLLAYFGGPVQPQLGTVIYGYEPGSPPSYGGDEETHSEIFPGVGMTQHIDELHDLAGAPPPAMRLILGYAGWGDGQLVREILRNDWVIAPVSTELIFGSDPTGIWDSAFASVGIDPATLPAWTADGTDGDAPAN